MRHRQLRCDVCSVRRARASNRRCTATRRTARGQGAVTVADAGPRARPNAWRRSAVNGVGRKVGVLLTFPTRRCPAQRQRTRWPWPRCSVRPSPFRQYQASAGCSVRRAGAQRALAGRRSSGFAVRGAATKTPGSVPGRTNAAHTSHTYAPDAGRGCRPPRMLVSFLS